MYFNKLDKNWRLIFNDETIPALVPGDITIDFFNAKKIKDPYFAENYKECEWIGRTNFIYQLKIDIDENIFQEDVIDIVFKGVDLYSSVYINGHHLGDTKNMFLKYVFDIKPYIKIGSNLLEVKMFSTLNKMDTFDLKDYESIFNRPRIFVRKAQCHFGWDWAPKICGYGIWDDVYLHAHSKYQIKDCQIIAHMDGTVTFFSELTYNTKSLLLPDGRVAVPAEKYLGDHIKVSISTSPDSNEYISKDIVVSGKKGFVGFEIKNPELWWPIGYGEQPLYKYKLELIRDNKVLDIKEGKFAFRDVELIERPKSDNIYGFSFYINQTPIYIKGSNWVPIECFTGVVKDQKYRDLIKLAKDGNFNLLRVWGGGIYEKDIFYDLCDENGLLVWQDICLACADVPEEDQEFVSNLLEEVEYQVKRLRNHPSLIYWTGGNEKTGTYGLTITHGDFLVDNVLYGVINNFDGTRPYRKQSPYSKTDIGNDVSSGESHYGVFELSLIKGLSTYRKRLCENIVPFVSECAVLGPSSIETLKKIFPEDHYWPVDEMWKDRFMENPYASVLMDFPKRELKFAEELYGKVDSLEDFVPKAMMVHAEAMRAEMDYARANKGINFGFANWMFSDIWPSGTWATIDYYLEPKQVYYQMRRSFKSIYASFYEDKDEDTRVFAVNDTLEPKNIKLNIFERTFAGEIVNFCSFDDLIVDNSKATSIKLNFKPNNNNYLVVVYEFDNKLYKTIYSPNMYSMKHFDNKFEYRYELVDSKHLKLFIRADSFVKSLFIHFKDNYKYIFSDNYLDLEKGEEVVIDISSLDDIDVKEMTLEPYRG